MGCLLSWVGNRAVGKVQVLAAKFPICGLIKTCQLFLLEEARRTTHPRTKRMAPMKNALNMTVPLSTKAIAARITGNNKAPPARSPRILVSRSFSIVFAVSSHQVHQVRKP